MTQKNYNPFLVMLCAWGMTLLICDTWTLARHNLDSIPCESYVYMSIIISGWIIYLGLFIVITLHAHSKWYFWVLFAVHIIRIGSGVLIMTYYTCHSELWQHYVKDANLVWVFLVVVYFGVQQSPNATDADVDNADANTDLDADANTDLDVDANTDLDADHTKPLLKRLDALPRMPDIYP